jgi:uncharacterized protein (DUF2147 family)
MERMMNTHRQFWPLAVAVVAPLMAGAAPAGTGTPGLTGNWARDDGGTRITIAPCGGAEICAVNEWVQNPKGPERVGDELILTLQPVTADRLKGQAYDVRRKLHFTMTITLNGAAMRTSGCVFLGLLCKSASWTRIN